MISLNGRRVAVIGGSIGGCATAALLTRLGADVTVLERSSAVLDDRGAGISTSKPHLEQLQARGLVDHDMPVVDRTTASRLFTTRESDPEGRVLWEQPIATYGMNWGIFYSNLRRRVPEQCYRGGVSAALPASIGLDRVEVSLSDGTTDVFDLVVVADGYASDCRRAMFPELDMEYGGYVAWRGLIPETGIDPNRPATEMAMHDGGHCVVYYVPGANGETAVGGRRVNWVWYRSITDEALNDVLVDRHGRHHRTSLPRAAARDDVVAALHGDARRLLRRVAADVVAATPDPFLQVVYDVRVPTNRVGRVAILGDAACVARPHTGAGALKATHEAMALADALVEARGDIDAALDSWNDEIQVATQRLFAQGRALGRAMVLEAPDWSTFDADRTAQWWAKASAGSAPYYAEDAAGR